MKTINNQEKKESIRQFMDIQKDYQYFWNKAAEALKHFDNREQYPVETAKQQYKVMCLQKEKLKEINAEYQDYVKKKGDKRGADPYRFYNEFIKPSEQIIENKRLEAKYGARWLTQKLWLRELILRLIGKK